MVAHLCQSKKVKKKTWFGKKKKKIRKKQNYLDPWMQNMIKKFLFRKKAKITMACKCQIWCLVTRLYI